MIRVYDKKELSQALSKIQPGERVCYHSRRVGEPGSLTSYERAMFELARQTEPWRPIMLFTQIVKNPVGSFQYYLIQGVDRRHKKLIEDFFKEEKEVPRLKHAA